MIIIKKMFLKYTEDVSGATAIEYGLLASIIAIGIIVGSTGMGKRINDVWNIVFEKVEKT